MLEVAAGTGLVTTAIAPVVGELISTDYATEMVTLESRVRETGHRNITREQAEICNLRFTTAYG